MRRAAAVLLVLFQMTTLVTPSNLKVDNNELSDNDNDNEYRTEQPNSNSNSKSKSKSHNSERVRYTYDHSFPSRVEEYNPFRFDPTTVFGAPYGGYARATRSRLAALPLRFVGNAGFASSSPPSSSSSTTTSGSSSSSSSSPLLGLDYTAGTGDESTSHTSHPSTDPTNEAPSPHGPYFTTRDGLGRLFACRVYREHELEPRSIFDSVFDEAYEIGAPIPYPPGTAEQDSARSADAAADGSVGGRVGVGARAGDGVMDAGLDVKGSADESQETHVPRHVLDAVSKLNNICAQIHQGWWSYEWCHENDVSQFHVDITGVSLEEAMASAMRVGGREYYDCWDVD